MSNKTIFKIVGFGSLFLILLLIIGQFIVFSNSEIRLRNSFEQKMKERTAFYDKMAKIFSQKSQIAVKNDSSFRKNIDIIMSAREDSEQVMFKWITESNPNSNYAEVSALYKDLSRAIEAQREGFLFQEKILQDIVRQHTDYIQTFPNSFYNMFMGRELLVYEVIQSDLTREVMRTGTDNNTKLNLD